MGLTRYGWEPVLEGGNVIALSGSDGTISLEPAGQLELSGAPLDNLHETCAETGRHLEQVKNVGDTLGLGFLGLGMWPDKRRDELPVMPKGRYGIMLNHMPRVGSMGLDMMLRTCTIQVNLDYCSEPMMAKMFRTSLALQPIATALFANSPFTEGKPNGFLSYRSHIWSDTDGARTGMLPFVFEDGFGYERYADYALDVPMYFVYRDGKYIDAAGQSFRDFLKGRLPALPGELPRESDWADHLSTAFPEVRLKSFLEMRGADGGPWSRICALPAFWVGLLYDNAALDAAWDVVKHWTMEERQALRDDVPRLALDSPIRSVARFRTWHAKSSISQQQGLPPVPALTGRAITNRAILIRFRRSSLRARFRRSGCSIIIMARGRADRKSVVEGKRVSVRVDLGGRRFIKKKNKPTTNKCNNMRHTN